MAVIRKLQPLQGPAAYTPDWHALRVYDPDRADRPVVIGASEAAAAMNVSKYSSALQLYLEKRGELPSREESPEALERMEMGLELEPVIMRRYSKRLQVRVQTEIPMLFHPDYPWLAATPDGIAEPDAQPWTVDCKAPGEFRYDPTGRDEHAYGEEGTDQVPLDNLLQAQHQMAVTGLDRCDFPVLFGGRILRVYRVERDDTLIAAMVAAEQELVERIRNGDPPDPNYRHSETKRCLEALRGMEVGTVVTLPREWLAMWERTEELKEEIAALETEREELRLRILHAAGHAEKVLFEDSPLRLKRIVVRDTLVTDRDVEELRQRVGQVKRAGYQFLRQVKS